MLRWVVGSLAAAALLALVVGALFPKMVLQAVGDFLIVNDPLEPVDAVVAISGDGTGERARKAAQLVVQGYGRWIILSGSRGKSTWDMVDVALAMGIPRERILVDDRSESTLDNARHSAALMEAKGLRRAIVVTSEYHARRAAWVFRSVFRSRRLDVRVVSARNEYFHMERWWTWPENRVFVLREYAKLGAFLLGFR